jgi:PPK2 family polyphosphate:nucleotide phosphotransferase
MLEAPSKKRFAELIKPFHVKPGSKVSLKHDFDPAFKMHRVHKDDADDILHEGIELLAEYQARLAAEGTRALLIVLQALDAAGKDGTIGHVMSGVNPQGVEVRGFKVPSSEDLSHDYLWRYAKALPERGKICIFNRSHYEEVLVVRVHPQNLVREHLPPSGEDEDVWERRFREINNWERYLVDNGIHVVKLFLNVSKEEQRQRFLARIDEPEKNWKFSANDARERECWDDYQKAYEEVLSNTSTKWAPWYVIPADHKWFMRLASGAVILYALMEIDPQYPEVTAEQRKELLREGVALSEESPEKSS